MKKAILMLQNGFFLLPGGIGFPVLLRSHSGDNLEPA